MNHSCGYNVDPYCEVCKGEGTVDENLPIKSDLAIDGSQLVQGPAWTIELSQPEGQLNGIYTVSTRDWTRPPVAGDRLLVTKQTDPRLDGVYVIGRGDGNYISELKLTEAKRYSPTRNRSGNSSTSKDKNRRKAKAARKARKVSRK